MHFMHLFSADAKVFSKKKRRPKISPNHIFCSIKMSPCATLLVHMCQSWSMYLENISLGSLAG